jgi:uncharacterized LabA/DUF88 family protein
MVADELRRQCDHFIELRDLEMEISRPRDSVIPDRDPEYTT